MGERERVCVCVCEREREGRFFQPCFLPSTPAPLPRTATMQVSRRESKARGRPDCARLLRGRARAVRREEEEEE